MTPKTHKALFQYIYLILFLSIPISSNAQELKNTIYYGNDFFILEGTQIADSLKENRYDR